MATKPNFSRPLVQRCDAAPVLERHRQAGWRIVEVISNSPVPTFHRGDSAISRAAQLSGSAVANIFNIVWPSRKTRSPGASRGGALEDRVAV